MRVRRHWRAVALSVLGLGLLDGLVAAFSQVWNAYDPHPYVERFDTCRRGAWDLVVVGGSPALYGLDPRVLSGLPLEGQPLARVYNLGLPLATAAEVYHAVANGLPRPPRLLLYGICASDFTEDRVEPCGPLHLMGFADVASWSRHRPKAALWCATKFAEGRLERLWQLYHHRRGLRLWAVDQMERFWPGTFPETAAEARQGLTRTEGLRRDFGFASPEPGPTSCLDALKAAAGPIDLRQPVLEKYRIGGYLHYLHRLLDWAEERGVRVVLVDMPVSADLEESLYPHVFATYRARLAEVERRRHVRVLRPTRADLDLVDADFADLFHLNARGAARVSTWVRQSLAER